MKKISFIGSPKTINKDKKIKEILFKIKQEHPHDVLVFSGGNETGFESVVKKYCKMFNLMYKEFNPAFTEHNEDSFFNKENYGKKYHYTHIIDRYDKMIRSSDSVIFGYDEEITMENYYIDILKKWSKKDKKIILI